MIPLLLALQGALPTVGDTVWLRRTIPVAAGWTVRAPDWDPTGPVQRLGRPRVVRRGDSAEVAWPVAVWVPGEHLIEVPGPVLVRPDGVVDSLPPAPVSVVARSILPVPPPDSTLAPQPPAPVVPTRETTVVPLLVAWGAAGLLLAPVHWWWRRRGPAPAAALAPPPPVAAGEPPVDRWADAGERRAVIDAAAERLRRAIESRRSDAPLDEAEALLASLEAARFTGGDATDAPALYRRAVELERGLAA
ncbi:MAG TPA: hypothetical protein VFU46_14065 [Gemmatimonadales bacterium]|nr:hypothetical protein [Gemmatimonadales bacterium]